MASRNEEILKAMLAGETPSCTPQSRMEKLLFQLCQSGGGSGSGAQPDWSAAEGEAGYIKNRTHYEEMGTIIPETAVKFDSNNEAYLTSVFDITAGQKYVIGYNGNKTEVEPTYVDEFGVYCIVTDELLILDGRIFGLGSMVVSSQVGVTTCTLSVDGIVTTKIPKKYLPNNLAETYTIYVTEEERNTLSDNTITMTQDVAPVINIINGGGVVNVMMEVLCPVVQYEYVPGHGVKLVFLVVNGISNITPVSLLWEFT